MSRPRMALVGLGMAVRPHAQSYLDLAERVELAYAYSPSAERRAAFAADFPFPIAESLEQVLEDESVTAVALLTPPNTHLELVERCAAAGKHVLLEKPLEVSPPRCLALVVACERAGVTLGVVLQHRFRSSGLRLRALLADGALGRLAGASVSIRNWRPQDYYDQPGRGELARDGGGVLLTQGIHTLDLFQSLVGMPEEVFAYATTSAVHEMETEDLVAGSLRFGDGVLGSLEATTAAYPGHPERISLIGEAGCAEIVGTSLEVRWHDGRTETLEAEAGQGGTGGGTGADPMAFPNDTHRALIADFLDALEQGRKPAVTGREALKVHRLIEALLQSAETGAAVRLSG